jgi:hypothetical protein
VLRVSVAHGLGGASGALFAGADVAAAPFAGGVLYPSAPWRIVSHVLDGVAGVAGAGSWTVSAPVPAGLVGASIVAQAVYADPAAVGGWSLSRGLKLELP